ncbi:unnamed protein product [Prorocentrum cordatum]|uniref:ATPTG10-like domain-containing protein n=1 Tax=Prorocentrum cordatum TaxID=2364126 RepID=A0ABN9WNQ5_9DINO|nr:unnamed protein product [Polarella glacialis]|mmetsp:Transcript_118361/g.317437  ORF Transcript_118361/g.317437 Transcript_118361/m.317437 type:complete len:117 (-) Transcript_118361:128-478(-)
MAQALAGQDPKAVQSLISDLKMLAAYETAADWREPKAMESAFQAVSWDDAAVAKAVPDYLASTGAERAKVDYAFNALVPRPPQDIDGKQAAIHTWLKARLFTYNKAFPFQFGPYKS